MTVTLEVTLKDLYVGRSIRVLRDKNVIKPATGKRKCNCKNKLVTKQVGPGMYQQFQQQECEECPNVKYAREENEITVEVRASLKPHVWLVRITTTVHGYAVASLRRRAGALEQAFARRNCGCTSDAPGGERWRMTAGLALKIGALLQVDPGMRDGHEISFFEEGEPVIDGEPGDLKFRVATAPHPLFTRDGNHLHYQMTISLVDALVGYDTTVRVRHASPSPRRAAGTCAMACEGGARETSRGLRIVVYGGWGWAVQIEHLDGHKVKVSSAKVTRPGDTMRIAGEGMPLFERGKQFGDLYLHFTVDFPPSLTEAQKKTVRDTFK